jgi:putative transposase
MARDVIETEGGMVQQKLKGTASWGGRREGAGRKPSKDSGIPHRSRPTITRRTPVHVTLRMAAHVWNLRSQRSFRVIERTLRACGSRFGVKIVDLSIQGNHIHLVLEVPDHHALGRAMKGFTGRLALGLNAMMGRTGPILADRYHAHVLRTPTEVRRALNYLRDNARRHAAERGEHYALGYVDPYAGGAPALRALLPSPDTWLLREGWRRGR